MKLLWRAESFSAGNPLQPFTARNTLIRQAQRLLPAVDVHPRSVNPFVEGDVSFRLRENKGGFLLNTKDYLTYVISVGV